ncbi:pyridine nucleotide-disulfide oxidoreductase [Cooperia oncophora]
MSKFLQTCDDDPIVVVGGGISASTFVEHVRLNGSKNQLIMVTNENVQPYDRVLLTKRPSSEAKDIRFRSDDFYSDNHILIMMGTKVGGIDTNRHSVAMSTGKRWRYSKLVLALGVVPKKLNVPGADLKQNNSAVLGTVVTCLLFIERTIANLFVNSHWPLDMREKVPGDSLVKNTRRKQSEMLTVRSYCIGRGRAYGKEALSVQKGIPRRNDEGLDSR